MKPNFSLQSPLQSILWTTHTSAANKILYNTVLVILGSLLIALAAQFAIPLQPVPITLETFAVLFLGMTYGWQLGSLTVCLYLLEGACGMPVFTGALSGLHALFGPTGGYLLGFLPATFLSGLLVAKGWGKNAFAVSLAAVLSLGIIFAFGVLVLSFFIGWSSALNLGLLPFIPGEIIKIILLALIIPRFWKNPIH